MSEVFEDAYEATDDTKGVFTLAFVSGNKVDVISTVGDILNVRDDYEDALNPVTLNDPERSDVPSRYARFLTPEGDVVIVNFDKVESVTITKSKCEQVPPKKAAKTA